MVDVWWMGRKIGRTLMERRGGLKVSLVERWGEGRGGKCGGWGEKLGLLWWRGS